jgi:hypothetical protein
MAHQNRNEPAKVVDPTLYQHAWEVYRTGVTGEKQLAQALGIGNTLAGRLINVGIVELSLPPLRRKLVGALQLAQQLDVDEAAQSMALSRTLIRGLIKVGVKRLRSLDADPEQISAQTLMTAAPRLALTNEELSKTTAVSEDATDKLIAAAASVGEAYAGVLKEIASQRLPRAPAPGRLPIKAELKDLLGDDLSEDTLAQLEDSDGAARLRLPGEDVEE